MRVIAGQAKGCSLKAPRGMSTRPTSDRVKEAIFNILGERVPASRFLDLFAGTGGIGIEALSRGAEHATFVEKGNAALKALSDNLARTKLQDQGRVLAMDVFRGVEWLAEQGESFSLIFLDPPYARGLAENTLQAIVARGLLAPGGMALSETGQRENLPEKVGNLLRVRVAVYGDTAVHFYRDPGNSQG
ncbi:hypothetical protein SY88_06845 [Clostridiales bacterium PH28_bin88]|nr:hypothetical protein SY88_06845 [Clostridiales bacterium PH28_bin88]